MQHVILGKCLKRLPAFVSLSMSGFIFPPRPLSTLLRSQVPSPSPTRATSHSLPLGRKEGGRHPLCSSLPRASFSPTLQGGGGRGRPSYATRTFLRGEGGRAGKTDGRTDRKTGVGGGTNTKSLCSPPSLSPSFLYPGESVFRSRLAYRGRSEWAEEGGGGGYAVAAAPGLNAKRRLCSAVGRSKNAASSIAIGRK